MSRSEASSETASESNSGAVSRRVVVTGVGLVSPLGDDPQQLYQALAAGTRGLRQVSLFETDALGPRLAGEIADFDPATTLGRANYRPVDRTARLVIVAAHQAFEASGWDTEKREEHDVGLVLGTMFGSVHTISAFDRRALVAGPKYAKPFEFANSVINAAAGQTAIWHNLRGINSTIGGGTAAGLQALIYATEAIRTGRSDALLAGGADELCFESFYGFHRTGQLGADEDGAATSAPFAARRSGFYLGEGAGLLMLEEAESARRRGAKVLAEIRGHGTCYDCSRGADERAADAVQRAIGLALADAGLTAADIDAVSAAANGSLLGDRHEAQGLAAAFPGREDLPVTAVKSMLGEALGASGAFATIALLEALGAGTLPGIPGLEEPEAGLPLTGLGTANRSLAGRRGLVDAVGLDGNVAALVVERSDDGELAARPTGES
ncbi:MAG: beta-ketoacyl-[acyl-carrier-protein] synthase family protein [Acidobacteriota bacterium]